MDQTDKPRTFADLTPEQQDEALAAMQSDLDEADALTERDDADAEAVGRSLELTARAISRMGYFELEPAGREVP